MGIGLLYLALLAPPASATSYKRIPTVEGAFADSSVAVHAVVTGTEGCTGESSRAWTFVDLDVLEVLRGRLARTEPGRDIGASPTLLPSARPPHATGDRRDTLLPAPDTLRVRLPYGEYPDGTTGTIVDTPALPVGAEVVVLLSYDEDGGHRFMPFDWMGWSVFRVFRTSFGGSAVVNGFGQPLFATSHGAPVLGHGHPELRELYFTDPKLDDGLALAKLTEIAESAVWPGFGPAEGAWRGRLSVDITGDADARCDAPMAGIAEGGTLAMTGRCNADFAGATDIELFGTSADGGWTGTIVFTPAALADESREIAWSSSASGADWLVSASSGVHLEEGYSFTYVAALRAGFVGARPLISFDGFRDWLAGLAETHAASAGLGRSINNDAASCNTVVHTAPLEE